MIPFFHQKRSLTKQYLFSVTLIMLVSGLCFPVSDVLGYRVVALILLAAVSIIAMFFDFFPVIAAALLSALTWDFFFIPPRFTFQVTETEDALMLMMYFVIALLNAVLMYKVRQMEKKLREEDERIQTLKLYNTVLNSLSHELRTPISAIIAASDNLLSASEKIKPEDHKNLIQEISVASLRLDRQVQNLLNMSRLESGFIKPRKDWVDIRELIHSVINRFDELKAERTIFTAIPPEIPLFRIDAGLIEQVIYNLLYNAMLYTPHDARIEITVKVSGENGVLIISDNGPGFPDAETEKVFQKFYRLSEKTGGTGLGLSIVRGFTEAHGGKVVLRNLETGGAEFTIQIPCEMSNQAFLKNE